MRCKDGGCDAGILIVFFPIVALTFGMIGCGAGLRMAKSDARICDEAIKRGLVVEVNGEPYWKDELAEMLSSQPEK